LSSRHVRGEHSVQLFHYRDKQQRKVDVVIERHDGDVVGVEIKASATPPVPSSPACLHLLDRPGGPLVERRWVWSRAAVNTASRAASSLHPGADTLPFGDRLAAVPVAGLGS